MIKRLARKKVEVVTHQPRVPYRETISANGQAQYRHKKQTGGRGQFAEVHLRVAPLERGANFEFVDEIVGGSIPRNFLPAVEKGIRETLVKGVIAGYPFVDVRVTVYAGINGMDQEGDMSVIKANVPLSEMMNYSTELRSITAGEGDYEFSFAHYEQVPAHVADGVIARHKKELAAAQS